MVKINCIYVKMINSFGLKNEVKMINNKYYSKKAIITNWLYF